MIDQLTSIWTLFGEELADRLLITMLHFLWQATIVAVLAWLMAIVLRQAASKVRYAMYCTSLASLPLMMAITFTVYDHSIQIPSTTWPGVVSPNQLPATAIGLAQENSVRGQQTIIAIEKPANTGGTKSLGRSPFQFHDVARVIVGMYLLGVTCFLVRLLFAVHGGSRLRAHANVVHDTRLCQQIADQARLLQLHCVPKVAYCPTVIAPTVVGLLRPMILLPTTLATGLTPEDFNAILRHEFAHIRRFDLWVNLGQRILESLLFFHPAVWWLSRRISAERELCCDDMVVSSGFLSIDYAGALLRMAERCAEARPARAVELAADGQNRSLLEYRIFRLLAGTTSSRFHLHRGGLAALVFVLVTLISIPSATLHFAQAQAPIASSRIAPFANAPAPQTSGQEKEVKSSEAADTGPFGRPTPKQSDSALHAAFPPGVFGDEDHESTKKKVFQWIAQAQSGDPAEREAAIEPLSKYLGASDEISKILMPLTYDSNKRVRAAAARLFFLEADKIRTDPNVAKSLRYRMVFTMVREEVHSDLTVPFLVEMMKVENASFRRAVSKLVILMVRLGHNEVLDQMVLEQEDPKIVDKNEYYRAIEVFKDERTKLTRAKFEASKRQASKGQSSNVNSTKIADPFGGSRGKTDPFGRTASSGGAEIEDPFGPPKPLTPTVSANMAANDAVKAFAALEKPAIVAELSSAETRINNALSDETTVRFIDTPLQEALRSIGRQHAIPLVLNRQALEEFGLTPDVPVTLDLANVSLRSALRLLLRTHQLEMMIQRGVLQITTQGQMRSTSLSRKYKTDRLPYSGMDIARSLQRVLDAMTVAGDAKPVVEYLSGSAGEEGIIWVQANEAAQREALGKLNWLLNK